MSFSPPAPLMIVVCTPHVVSVPLMGSDSACCFLSPLFPSILIITKNPVLFPIAASLRAERLDLVSLITSRFFWQRELTNVVQTFKSNQFPGFTDSKTGS